MATGAAHHIVAGGARQAQRARDVRLKFGVTLNAAENGIFLPKHIHDRIHTSAYYARVNEMLEGATSKEDVIRLLKEIREGLAEGTFR